MDEQAIEHAGRQVAHLDLADHILSWDKRQVRDIIQVTRHDADPAGLFDTNEYRILPNPDARRCQAHPEHGILQIGRSGDALMCCVTRPTPCDYAEPVSR